MKPLNTYVILKKQKLEEGIIMPDAVEEAPEIGVVVADATGFLKEGQEVFFDRYLTREFRDEENTYIFVKFEDIIAIL